MYDQAETASEGPMENDDRPVGIIEEKISQLHAEMGELDRRIERFIGRVDPILGPDMNDKATKDGLNVPAAQSVLANELDTAIQNANRMLLKVKAATDRIEV